MQPESIANSEQDFPILRPQESNPTIQHGLPEDHSSPSGLPRRDAPYEYAVFHVESDSTSSTLSPSTGCSNSGVDDAQMSPIETISPQLGLSSSVLVNTTSSRKTIERLVRKNLNFPDDRSPMLEFPEEILSHIISHLSPADLLTVKLVCRRFRDVVNSPHAWINAFSRYFPGSDSLKSSVDNTASESNALGLRSEKRAFTRLTPVASWTGEYLSRTQLLRCLMSGKPSLPFASPTLGRPGRGSATFTFSSRLGFGVTHLHATYGHTLDKRMPQFIHGMSRTGAVLSCDRNGRFDSWGLSNPTPFSQFANRSETDATWGLGSDEVISVPNVMSLSQPHGMVYGEGVPGGHLYFSSVAEKQCRCLALFLGISNPDLEIPKISQDRQSICAVWIAKSPAVPLITNGLIGILSGSSCGAVTAYSLGSTAHCDHRLERGEITARWMLSPGVPIIAIIADDDSSLNRIEQNRVWVIALNALGEVFYLDRLPTRVSMSRTGEEGIDREVNAWATGRSVLWHLIGNTKRIRHSNPYKSDRVIQNAFPQSTWNGANVNTERLRASTYEMESWLRKTPSLVRGEFQGWNMRRKLEVDFAGDDGNDSGESVFVIDAGEDEDQTPAIRRFTKCKMKESDADIQENTACLQPHRKLLSRYGCQSSLWSFPPDSKQPAKANTRTAQSYLPSVRMAQSREEWHSTRFSFGRYRSIMITNTALDMSKFALTTSEEDVALYNSTATSSKYVGPMTCNPQKYSPFQIPGQRARLIAAGTGGGTVFVWNARAPGPGTVNSVNTIKPIRIIHTESPQITSLALSALYLVHGGSEGLVQAWDVLASSMCPIRTLTSRSSINQRRRAIAAVQQHPNEHNQLADSLAAGAISLDPDPTVLRGVVAIGTYLRYWSFSSATAAEDLSKSQKRRQRRSECGFNPSPGQKFVGVRRIGLKGFMAQELIQKDLEERERKFLEKEDKLFAGRYGLDLLGYGASEEEIMAYAKMVSEEEYEKRQIVGMEDKLSKDASEEQVEAYKSALSPEDFKKWKYASWEERFGMPVSGDVTATHGSTSATPISDHDDDINEAIELSLKQQQRGTSHDTLLPPTSSSDDDDFTKAIETSLTESTGESSQSQLGTVDAVTNEDDDLAKSLSLSFAETSIFSKSPPSSSDRSSHPKSSWASVSHDEFPILGSSPGNIPPVSRKSNDKGNRRAA